MYSNGMSVGKRHSVPMIEMLPRMTHAKLKTEPRAECGIIEHMAHRTGEYDDREASFVGDPYVDGCKWAKAGKALQAHKERANLSTRNKSEYKRLFEMGFKDEQEAKRQVKK